MGNDVNANSLIRELLMSYSSRVINSHVTADPDHELPKYQEQSGKQIIIKHLKTTCFKLFCCFTRAGELGRFSKDYQKSDRLYRGNEKASSRSQSLL
jgi:hypothetical protein